MLYVFIASALFAVIAAYMITLELKRRIRKANTEHFLHQRQGNTLKKLNAAIIGLGEKHQKELEQKLVDAGIYNRNFARYYLPAKVLILVVSLSVVALAGMSMQNKVLLGAFLLVGILVIPDMALELRKKALIQKTSRQLPYMLDMMAVCVQTGMTVEASLIYLSKELDAFDKDLCFQIRKTAEAAKMQGLEKALHDLSLRLPTPEVRSFVFTLIQNLQYGTSISNVLSDLSEDIRKMQVMSVEEKIGKLSAKMSVPLILFIMFPIVVLIIAPGVMQLS
ncbi:type II secretion system F family protein [Veronia pacifica]|uniref:Biotin synthase n=1 Tax=Veronia pacifica TaxID=1080227 RepID=A0A1C3ES99_9GAMM|nr:type II secretion system F family protein [Veronia pacifica]ODA36078.1 biotin synthase [Veronia pacifica]